MSDLSPPPAAIGRGRLTVALFLPALSWFLFQQGLSATMRAHCPTGGPPIGPLWGLAALTLCGLAAYLAWPARQSSDYAGSQISRFLALLALIGTGIFALAIAFQTLATVIIPPCIG